MKKTIKLLAALLITLLIMLSITACDWGNDKDHGEDFRGDVFIGYKSCELIDGEVFAYDYEGDRIVCDNIFIEINGDVYFAINNFIVFNQTVINGSVYDFGDDGKMVTGEKGEYTYGDDGKLVADQIFITINGDVYFVINNTIVFNQIIINGAIYDFGDDGKMVTGEKGEYTYGEDGKLVANELFITINGDVYFVMNNTIVYNQVIINGAIYDFGDDGKMVTGEKGEYTYGEDGKLVADQIFITINGDVYFVMNNTIVYNQVIINGAIYDFGDDGKMVTGEKGEYTYGEDGKLIADQIFITINGDVYFIFNNTIVYNQVIINGAVYDFGDDGKMVTGEKGEFTYGEDGKLIASKITITINGNVWFIFNNVAFMPTEDCDADGLSNEEELALNTDLYNGDTDGDGASDGREVLMGFDPLSANTSFGVTFAPVVDNEDKEDTVVPTIDIELKGDQVDSLTVERNDFFNEDTLGYLGDAYKYSVEGEVGSATIGFEFNPEMLGENSLPTIYQYDEETNRMIPLDTKIEGNKATAEVDELSTFVILDRNVYEQDLEWVDIWGLDGKTYTDIELVFVIDDSGSMRTYDPSNQRLLVAKNLIDAMPEGSKVGIVKFDQYTKYLTNSLTTDKSLAKSYLTTSYFTSNGSYTYMFEAVRDSANYFSMSTEDDSVFRVMVVLSDGIPSSSNNKTAALNAVKNAGVSVYTVGFGSNESNFTNYLKPLSDNTGAKFYYSSNANGLSEIFSDIGEKIDLTTDSDGDGLLDYYEDNMVVFNGVKYQPDKTKADTDGDGLLDGEEIQTVIIISVDGKQMSVIGRVRSDPTNPDSDNDGVGDADDLVPLNPDVQ